MVNLWPTETKWIDKLSPLFLASFSLQFTENGFWTFLQICPSSASSLNLLWASLEGESRLQYLVTREPLTLYCHSALVAPLCSAVVIPLSPGLYFFPVHWHLPCRALHISLVLKTKTKGFNLGCPFFGHLFLCTVKHVENGLNSRSATVSFEGPDSKYFRFCELYHLCLNYSFLPL